MKPVIDLIVDSGAYSAFTQGKAINLTEYTDFCIKNSEYIRKVVNLDVINPKGPEVAAAAGWENLLYMQLRGVNAMPVYHAREHLRWFDKMLDACDYIGISGTSLVNKTEHLAFYDLAWHYGTDSNGFPIAKYHAFGDTAPLSMLTYPWFSADSATWMIQSGRAARVKLQGKSYQLRSSSIRDTSYISNDDPLPKKKAWEKEIRELGLDPTIVMNVVTTASEMAMIRSYLVASDLLKLQEESRLCTSFKKSGSLVLTKKKTTGGEQKLVPIEMYFVISPSAWYFNLPIIAALGITKVLVSYYYIDTAPAKFWDERLMPFLYNPVKFCEENPKLRKYWDKLQEVLLKSSSTEAVL